jgi:hypothetical protein
MGLVGQKVLPNDLFTKDIKKAEKMRNDKNGLWKEPNFTEWYNRLKITGKRDSESSKTNHLLLDPEDSF